MEWKSESRRRFLHLVGSTAVVGVAGCAGAPEGEPSTTETEREEEEELPEGVSEDEFEHGPVPQ